jgi:octaprenyl-diphosphate synthase
MATVPNLAIRLSRAYDLIADRLGRVEEELIRHFQSPIPTVARMGDYVRQGGGKRIRPALLLLSARLLGYEQGDRDIRYGAVVEFIHTASLVHDDIMDEADLRRGRASVNARWGNNLTVLFGDYLYTKSMGVALDEGNLAILGLLSDTTLSMIEGEILSLERAADLTLSGEQALEIIRRKTADLFAAACSIPAYFAPGGNADAARRLAEYGRHLGIAFQLIDDLLDYSSRSEVVGKPVLSDLREGKLTMPLLLALPHATPQERLAVTTVIQERGFQTVDPAAILEIVDRYDALAATRRLAEEHATDARAKLSSFPEGEARDALEFATDSVIDRIA